MLMVKSPFVTEPESISTSFLPKRLTFKKGIFHYFSTFTTGVIAGYIFVLVQKIDLWYHIAGDIMRLIVNLTDSEFSFHQHNEYEIIICTKGSGFFCSTEDIPVSQGSIIVVPPRVKHSCFSSDTLERIYIRGDFGHYFAFTAPVVVRDNARQENSMLAQMVYYNRYANQEYLAVLIDTFIHSLMQNIRTEDRIHLAVSHIVDQITAGFHDYTIDLQGLLKASGYAEDYIRAQFKKITGKTPIGFLRNVRIRHACYLIDAYGSTVALTEIAEKCGYADYVYFSKNFKAVTGVAPRTYIADTFGHDEDDLQSPI